MTEEPLNLVIEKSSSSSSISSSNNNNNNNKRNKMEERSHTDMILEFKSKLITLKNNDANIIKELTQLSAVYKVVANEIATLVEDKIRESDLAKTKLCSIYLLDSLNKNVAKVYNSIFSKNIVSIYVDTFEAVDDLTKASMLNLYNIWKERSLVNSAMLTQIHQQLSSEMERIAIQYPRQNKSSSSSGSSKPHQQPQQTSNRTSQPPSSSPTTHQQQDAVQQQSNRSSQPQQQQFNGGAMQNQGFQGQNKQQQQQPFGGGAMQNQGFQGQNNQYGGMPNQQQNFRQQPYGNYPIQNQPIVPPSNPSPPVDPRFNKGSAPQNNAGINNNNNNMMNGNLSNTSNMNNNMNNNNMMMNNNNMMNGNMNNNNNMMNGMNNNNNMMNNNMNRNQGMNFNNNNGGMPNNFYQNMYQNNNPNMYNGPNNFNNNNGPNMNNNNGMNNSGAGSGSVPSYFASIANINIPSIIPKPVTQPSPPIQQTIQQPPIQQQPINTQQITIDQNYFFSIIEHIEACDKNSVEELKNFAQSLKNTLFKGPYNAQQYIALKQEFKVLKDKYQLSDPKPISNLPSMNIINSNSNSKSAVSPSQSPSSQQQSSLSNLSIESKSGSVDNKKGEYSLYEDLYKGYPLQCKTCSSRFKTQVKLDQHMDWHYKVNQRIKKRSKHPMSRAWYLPEESWIGFEFDPNVEVTEQPSIPFFNEIKKEVEIKVELTLVADDDQTSCPVCREKFEKFWDSESEDWMYRGVQIDNKTKKIIHCKCVVDEKSISPTNSSSSSSSSSSSTNSLLSPLSLKRDSSVLSNSTDGQPIYNILTPLSSSSEIHKKVKVDEQ